MSEVALTECPACSSPQINTSLQFARGVCENCGRVIDDDTKETISGEVTTKEEAAGEDEKNGAWEERVHIQDTSDENLVELIAETDEVGQTLFMEPEDRERAVELVKQAWIDKLTHGRKMEVVVGAAVDLACRMSNEPRPLTRIAENVGVNESVIHRVRIKLTELVGMDPGTPHPFDYIPFITQELGAPELIGSKHPEEVEEEVNKIPGNPAGIAAARVYLEYQKDGKTVSYRELGDIVGLTKETIWKRTDDLRLIGYFE